MSAAASAVTSHSNCSVPEVVQFAKAMGDPLRANIVRVLAQDAFSVMELVDIFSIAQPALSHHLKILNQAGVVTKRKEGTSVFYQRSTQQSELQRALFKALDEAPLEATLAKGMEVVYAARSGRSTEFFANNADALAQHTTLICDPAVYSRTVLDMALQNPRLQRQHALEVGPGSGTLMRELLPHFKQVTGIDSAPDMLEGARTQLNGHTGWSLIEADIHQFSTAEPFDLLVMAMVLHHLPSPSRFFRQAADLLGPSGVLVIAELCAHQQAWAAELCGDIWLGFEPDELMQWAAQAGLQPLQQQFLAQRNGFRVQVHTFNKLNPE